MNNLSAWIFHFNEHTGLWAAINRQYESNYWSKMYPNENSYGIMFSEDITELLDLARKTTVVPKQTVHQQYGLFDGVR